LFGILAGNRRARGSREERISRETRRRGFHVKQPSAQYFVRIGILGIDALEDLGKRGFHVKQGEEDFT